MLLRIGKSPPCHRQHSPTRCCIQFFPFFRFFGSVFVRVFRFLVGQGRSGDRGGWWRSAHGWYLASGGYLASQGVTLYWGVCAIFCLSFRRNGCTPKELHLSPNRLGVVPRTHQKFTKDKQLASQRSRSSAVMPN